MGEITTLRIPFAQGLGQQTAQEWQDPNATAGSVINGNFTKAGAVDKRLGMAFAGGLATFLQSQGSPWVGGMTQGVQGLTWSKCAFGAAGLDANGLAAAYSVLDNGSGYLGLGPLPPPSVLRRGVPAATTASNVGTTPTIVDVPDGNDVRRLAFYVSGTAVWCVTTNSTGDLISAPLQIYSGGFAGAPSSIQAVYRPNASAATAIALLLVFGPAETAQGFTVNATGSAFQAGPTFALQAMDLTPFVGDPAGGFILAQMSVPASLGPVVTSFNYYTGFWTPQVQVIVESDSGVVANGIVVAANYGASEVIAVAYAYSNTTTQTFSIRYAAYSAAPGYAFTPVTSPTNVIPPVVQNTIYQLVGLTRISADNFLFVYFEPTASFNPTYWQNTMPYGFYGIISGGVYGQSGILPLGAYPVAKPFTVGGIPYMPIVTQFNSAFTPGTSPVGEPLEEYTASEQCTMYLLQFKLGLVGLQTTAYALPVATVAPRQVDPSFSSFFNGQTAPPPACSALTGTRFAVGLKTQAEDQAATQQSLGAAWWAEFRFDTPAQSQLFQADDVYGTGHIAGGVPFTCDGTQTYEHTFFLYPEFVSAQVGPSGVSQTFGTSLAPYQYAVVYKHFDATGQLTRGSPVIANPVVSTPLTLSGTVSAISGEQVTFSTAQTLASGTMLEFSSQTGVFYFVSEDSLSSTTAFLTQPYTGSSPSGATTQTAGNPFLLTFPPLSMTWRDLANSGQVYAEIYRTVAGGGVFYLIAEVSAFPQVPPSVGTVSAVENIFGGEGFVSAPTVVIDPPSAGVQATVAATISGGQIDGVNISNMGEYPQGGWPVTFNDSTGSGALGVAVIGPVPGQLFDGVVRVDMINVGKNYSPSATVNWSGGATSGSGAAGTPIITPNGQITGFTFVAPGFNGSGYSTTPNVTITGGGGTGAIAQAVVEVFNPNAAYPASYLDVNTPDAAITTNTILYTTGGVLDCVNPPSFYCQCLHWNRIWGVDETRRTIWFTKAFTPGETPGYNEALTISFPQDITGLWSLDDKLIIGTSTGLFIVYGQGPADNGQGSDLTIPQPVACDSGPVDWRSGVVYPGGFIFRSQTGFMLCDRSLNVSWIGKDVVDLLTSFPNVISAVMVPYATQVRFLCQQNGNAVYPGNVCVLVYDYLVQKWLEHQYVFPRALAGLMLTEKTPITPASYAMVGWDGALWLEQQPTATNAYMDQTEQGLWEFVSTSVRSAWFKIQGVNGYQRVKQIQVLYEEQDDSGIGMYFYADYSSDLFQFPTWTSQQLDELTKPVVQAHVAAAMNKSMAIQVLVYDTPGANITNGKGMRFVTLSLEMEKLADTYRQIAAIGRQ